MTTETEFHAALLDASVQVPQGLTDGQGRPAGRRYAVYRNNVAVSLAEALETGFPVVAKLLGNENFKGIAGLYLRQSPPADPRMMHYGAGFDTFLAGFAPLAHIGYLADVARLELALRAAYHAADATPVDPADLATLTPESRLQFAPAVHLVRSDWPLYDIWAYNMISGAPRPQAAPQDVIVTRPEFDPAPHPLPVGGGAVLGALMEGQSLGAALERGPEDFDLQTLIGLLLSGGAITGLISKESQ